MACSGHTTATAAGAAAGGSIRPVRSGLWLGAGGEEDDVAAAAAPHRHDLRVEPGPAQLGGEGASGPETTPRACRRAAAPRGRGQAARGVERVVARRRSVLRGRCRRRAGWRPSQRAPRRSIAPTSLDPRWSRADRRGCRRSRPAIGPRAQATTAGTSSAYRRRAASAGSTASAARSVKPMPSPPISTAARAGLRDARGERRQRLLRAGEPAVHEFALGPSMIEISLPRRFSRIVSRPRRGRSSWRVQSMGSRGRSPVAHAGHDDGSRSRKQGVRSRSSSSRCRRRRRAPARTRAARSPSPAARCRSSRTA